MKSVQMAGLTFTVRDGNLVIDELTFSTSTTVADALIQLKYILWLCQYDAVKDHE